MIKSHKELAEFLRDKTVLHANSLGKDSALCLEWLVKFARPKKIYSVNFVFLAKHPADEVYLRHQKAKYPQVEFFQEFNAHEISNIGEKTYQSPLTILMDLNKWEYGDFSMSKQLTDIRKRVGAEFVVIGNSKYESVARAMKFYKKGLLIEDKAYPLGLMTKKDVYGLIEKTGIRVHPVYRLAQSTIDYPSYYKMRSSFVAHPKYFKEVLGFYPMLALDKYRYEVLFKEGK